MAGNVSLQKAAQRARHEGLRRALTADDVERRGRLLQGHLEALGPFGLSKVVALYGAEHFEAPMRWLASNLSQRGVRCVYPRVESGQRVLRFSELASYEALELSPRGLPRPPLSAPIVTLDDIDLFVVPGVAFAKSGARLGRGGGYYDATLAAARRAAVRVGVCFESNVDETIPMESTDCWVDWLVTEVGPVETHARWAA